MLKSSDSVRTVISYRTDIHALTVTQPQEKEKLVGREKKEKRSPGEEEEEDLFWFSEQKIKHISLPLSRSWKESQAVRVDSPHRPCMAYTMYLPLKKKKKKETNTL